MSPAPATAVVTADGLRDPVEAMLAMTDASPEKLRRLRISAQYANVTLKTSNAPNSWGASLTPQKIMALMAYCVQYDLEPGLDVMVMGDQIYVRPDGRRKVAHRDRDENGKKTFAGMIFDRPMSKEERDEYGLLETEIGWVCSIKRADCELPFLGFGIANKSDRDAKRWPQQMAQARAHGKAFRMAYPMDLPTDGDDHDDGPVVMSIDGELTPDGRKESDQALVAVLDRLKGLKKNFGAARDAVLAARNITADDIKTMAASGNVAVLTELADAIAAEAKNAPAAKPAAETAGPRDRVNKLRLSRPDAFKAAVENAGGVNLDQCTAEELTLLADEIEARAKDGGA